MWPSNETCVSSSTKQAFKGWFLLICLHCRLVPTCSYSLVQLWSIDKGSCKHVVQSVQACCICIARIRLVGWCAIRWFPICSIRWWIFAVSHCGPIPFLVGANMFNPHFAAGTLLKYLKSPGKITVAYWIVQAALKEEQLRRAEAEVTRWLVVDECWWWWLMVLIMWDDVRWWLKDTKRAWRLKFEDAWGWWKVLTYWILYDLF